MNEHLSGATMADFASTLQIRVLDRPVIDQSGLTGRFDFTLNWTPDEFQFPNAAEAQRSTIPTGPDAPPDLFTAFQEQLGMKLGAAKAPVAASRASRFPSRAGGSYRKECLASPRLTPRY